MNKNIRLQSYRLVILYDAHNIYTIVYNKLSPGYFSFTSFFKTHHFVTVAEIQYNNYVYNLNVLGNIKLYIYIQRLYY